MFDLEKINEFVPFCLSCLGRSVGLVGFGLDNRERGFELMNLIELSTGLDVEKEWICESGDCKICDGLIGEIDNFIECCSTHLEYILNNISTQS